VIGWRIDRETGCSQSMRLPEENHKEI